MFRLSVHSGALTLVIFFIAGAAGAVAQQQGEPAGPVPVPATRSNTEAGIERRRWSGIVEPGEIVPQLSVEDKLLFPVHETLRPVSVLPMLVSGGYGILKNSDPKYGTNSEGFGERVGAAALRQASTRVFADGLLPIVFHEDPRYYRKAYGTYRGRTAYAFKRVFVDEHDNGHLGPNFSDILGRGMSSALILTYYPEASQGSGVVLRTWGISLLGDAGINVLQEFWPDIRRKLFTRGPK